MLRDFLKFWNELGELTNKEEIKNLKEQYHRSYLDIGWRSIWGIGVMAWTLQSFILLLSFKLSSMKMIIFPISGIILLIVVDQIIQRNKNLIESIFFYLNIIQGIIITHEGLHYSEYRFHEIWLVYYMSYLLVGVATWFKWK